MSEPLFWYRPVCNGEMYEGPIHNNSVGGKMLRDEKPGEWLPLYAEAQAQAELNAANARIAKLEALAQQQDTWLGKKTCAHSRCNELNAARALLREIIDAGGTVSIKLDDKVQLYLDACDKPGAPDAS